MCLCASCQSGASRARRACGHALRLLRPARLLYGPQQPSQPLCTRNLLRGCFMDHNNLRNLGAHATFCTCPRPPTHTSYHARYFAEAMATRIDSAQEVEAKIRTSLHPPHSPADAARGVVLIPQTSPLIPLKRNRLRELKRAAGKCARGQL